MPNQRKEGVARISVTLPEDMLQAIEKAAAKRAAKDPSFDRLAFIREALSEKLGLPGPKSGSSDKKR
jgi:metal-responsive CopG/Arc/MetJ family transcriptional regulator